jgi:glyoxylase-like metal-dependent hydrolase (beta-lactamase superfamily II)
MRWNRTTCFTVLTIAVSLLPSVIGAQSAPARLAGVRLYVFDCGRIRIADPKGYALKKEEVSTPLLSVPCYLVAHPKGTLIWDPGMIPDKNVKPGTAERGGAVIHPERTLRAKLAEAGFTPSDITYLALSHHHFDHSANANDFAGSTWLVRAAEREVMFADKTPFSTDPSVYSALKNSRTTIISGEHDVFGDGSVVILPTPGHTPGHQSLFVRFSKRQPVVLSGDLYHYPEERALNRIPPTDDVAQTAASRVALEAFLKKSGAELWIEHDFVLFSALRKSPQYYE